MVDTEVLRLYVKMQSFLAKTENKPYLCMCKEVGKFTLSSLKSGAYLIFYLQIKNFTVWKKEMQPILVTRM